MKFKWTIKELSELTDDQIVFKILQERESTLSTYSPLAEKLRAIMAVYSEKIKGAS